MQDKRLDLLIDYLLKERGDRGRIAVPDSEQEKFRLYRSLVNIRPAGEADESFLKTEEQYLKELTRQKGITDIEDLKPVEKSIYLWQGDITTLRCGAIVNAANSGMTGCYMPCHSCIDNCIHTFAGVRLRLECDRIMKEQGFEEPTGQAKITKAYDLPCEYVVHTVGPIVEGVLDERHCELLKSCYESCLELAVEKGIESIAFCCISTGVFGFPQYEAAQIAVRTVREFVKDNGIKVIFNVFSDKDLKIYTQVLGIKKGDLQ